MKKIRVLLADDHAVMRESLALLLNSQHDVDVIAEAANGRDAWQKARSLKPDVVVLDLSMPEMSGLRVAQALQRDCPKVKVLALTMHEDEIYVRELVRAKAAGYVLKRTASEELLRAVRNVASGGVHFDPALVTAVFVEKLGKLTAQGKRPARRLSRREEAVLRLAAWGFTNKEIAKKLSLSSRTVESHKFRFGRKLGLRSRSEMVRYASRRGWLIGQDPLCSD